MIHRSLSTQRLLDQLNSNEATHSSLPRLRDILDNPDNQNFPMTDLENLAKASNAEKSDPITDFVENGARIPNSDLRKVAALDSHKISASTEKLLQDLYGQVSCEARLAFRTYYAKPEAVDRLTTPGTHIADFGVQSANIHLPHAEGWSLEHPAEAGKKIIFVLDKNVPKKNLSTGFLADHVVVLPGEVLEISEVEERAGTTYVMVKAAQPQDNQAVYSPFDGTEYVNFSDKKVYLTSFKSLT